MLFSACPSAHSCAHEAVTGGTTVQKAENNRSTNGVSGEVEYGPIMVQHVSHSPSKRACLLSSVFQAFTTPLKIHSAEEYAPTEDGCECPLITMTVKSSATEPILSRIDSHTSIFKALLSSLCWASFWFPVSIDFSARVYSKSFGTKLSSVILEAICMFVIDDVIINRHCSIHNHTASLPDAHHAKVTHSELTTWQVVVCRGRWDTSKDDQRLCDVFCFNRR